MILNYENRDLLTVDRKKYVIAHCISADCAMREGIVVPIMKSTLDSKKHVSNIHLAEGSM